eukprot:s6669_g4.t2
MYHYSLLRQEIERCCTSLLMAPSPPKRRWSPKAHEEVHTSIRQFSIPLVGTHTRRLPLGKLPSLQAPAVLSARDSSWPTAEQEFDKKAASKIGGWLKGGSAAAYGLLARCRVMSDSKEDSESQMHAAKLAFELLKTLAFEIQDFGDLDANSPDLRTSRTWLLTSLLHHIQVSLFADEEVVTARKMASHYAAIAEDSIGMPRQHAQVTEDLARVNRWQMQEESPPRLSAQEMWCRRRGLRASQGAAAEEAEVGGEEKVNAVPMGFVSNVQRWHCTQLVCQIRWSNQIISTLDAQSSAAYNMLGLAQELMAGFVVGWAFAFWRLQYVEDKMAAQQLQKAERSTRINREYVGVFFTYWSLLTSGALCNRAKEELQLKKLHLRLLSVRLRDVEAKKTKSLQDVQYDKTAHYLIVRKMQALKEERSRLDFRFQTMPPVEARHSLHLVMEVFMDFVMDFGKLERLGCRHRLLGKDLIFLATDPAERQQDIGVLPAEEILVRWINCILAEAHHSASVLLTDAMDDENGRSNWAAADSSSYGFRCREVRAIPTLQTKSLEVFFQDGKILTVLYAMFRAYRRNKTIFDPEDLGVLDEKDSDRRGAAAQNAFVSLSPLLISRLLLSPLDVVSGQRFALKASLCTTLLREATGSLQDLSKRPFKQVSADAGRETERTGGGGEIKEANSMATVMTMFEKLVGGAWEGFVDLSRLCFPWEPLTALQEMALYDILRRWVNLQVYGVLIPQADIPGVKNLGNDLASGQVLLRLIKAVAPTVIEAVMCIEACRVVFDGKLEERSFPKPGKRGFHSMILPAIMEISAAESDAV